MKPAHGVDRCPVVGRDLRDAEERPEVHRGRVEEHQPGADSGGCGHRRILSEDRDYAAPRDVLHARGHRPADPSAAGGRRPDVLHRPREGHRAVHLRRAPARQAARAARPDPRLRRHGQPRRDRAAADGVHLDPADRPVPARRLAGAARGDPRDRVVLVGRRRRVLHPQGPAGPPERPRGPAGPDPRRRQRLDAHHHRALDATTRTARHRRRREHRRARAEAHGVQYACSAAVRRDASAISAARRADSSREACSAHHAWPSAGRVWIGS